MTEDMQQKSGGGCWKIGGIGCLLLLVVALVGGYFAFKNKDILVRAGTAKVMIVGAEAMFSGFQMSAEDKEAAMAPIHELAAKIKSGEVSMEQGGKILEELAQSSLPIVMTLKAFDVAHLQPSELSADEKKTARITMSRFAKGLMDKSIDQSTGKAISDIVTTKTIGTDGKESSELKKTITNQELTNCLQIMKEAADEAGIENKLFPVDIASEIRKAIEKGIAVKTDA